MESYLSKIIDEKIGSPFKEGSSGPDSFYCLGFIIWIYRTVYKAVLPNPMISKENFLMFKSQFIEDDHPLPGSLLLFQTGIDHVAIVENTSYAAECEKSMGVQRIHLIDAMERSPLIYRLKSDYHRSISKNS